jgi:hypothetical protein
MTHKGNVCVTLDSPHNRYRDGFPTIDGKIVYPGFLPIGKQRVYEQLINEWCKGRPRKDWPALVTAWEAEKKRLK